MKQKLSPAKKGANTDPKVKGEVPFSVRLYEECDEKVRERAGREGVAVAQVICDIVDEFHRQQELLPTDSERRDEGAVEIHRLQQTILQLRDELHAQRLFIESHCAVVADELHVHGNALHIGKLLGNAQYKLLGLILESQVLMQQLLIQYVVDPHLKILGAETDIHLLLAGAHAPDDYLSDPTKAVLRVAGTNAQRERIETCRELLQASVATEKSLQASDTTPDAPAATPQSPDDAIASATEETREKDS